MSDATNDDTVEVVTEELLSEVSMSLDQLASFEGATEIVRSAVDARLAASTPVTFGDHGEIRVIPADARVEITDVRSWENRPRFISGTSAFVDGQSFSDYALRYIDRNVSVLYGEDPHRAGGVKLMTSDTCVATIVLDDHPVTADLEPDDPAPRPGRRSHQANFVLRPTPAARRWGARLAGSVTQEQFLDLIADGIGEIAEPDAAELRDLVADLHAIRATGVQSVMRTSGETSLTLTDNVKLHSGVGKQVTLPETMTLVLAPFVGYDEQLTIVVRIKPKLVQNAVTFQFVATDLDQLVAEQVVSLVRRVGVVVDLPVLWRQ